MKWPRALFRFAARARRPSSIPFCTRFRLRLSASIPICTRAWNRPLTRLWRKTATFAISTDPNSLTNYGNLVNFTLSLQRLDEARQIIHEAQARHEDDLVLRDALYALAFLGSDPAGLAEQQKWFAAKSGYENFGLGLASDT